MEITFANLIPGYLDSNGLFTPLTALEIANGKEDLPKDVKLVVRGDIRKGPYDQASDGIEDLNSDKLADNPLDATASQYLVPDENLLAKNAHYYVRRAPALVGGIATAMVRDNGEVFPEAKVTILTSQPGEAISINTVPVYWYMVFQPVGTTSVLDAGMFLEVGVNPRLPYVVRSLARRGIFGVDNGLVEQP